jgi:hypothetical protein
VRDFDPANVRLGSQAVSLGLSIRFPLRPKPDISAARLSGRADVVSTQVRVALGQRVDDAGADHARGDHAVIR